MSFDLYFRAREGARVPCQGEFAAYFARRDDYEVLGPIARYHDEATGVSFEFSHGDRPGGNGWDRSATTSRSDVGGEGVGGDVGARDAGPSGGVPSPVVFRMPFCRPHTFALEAEQEVAAFVDAFDLSVSDPLMEGTGEGEFSVAAFLSAYDRGNERAVRVLLDHVADTAPHVMPSRLIEWFWYWNRHRRLSELARDGGRSYPHRRAGVFVPKVMFLEVEGAPRSAVVWPDGIPICLPAVDLLILARDRLGPRRLGRRRPDVCLLPFRSAREMLDEFPLDDRPLPHRLLQYGTPPEPVVAFFRAQAAHRGELRGIDVDRILDAELVGSAGGP